MASDKLLRRARNGGRIVSRTATCLCYLIARFVRALRNRHTPRREVFVLPFSAEGGGLESVRQGRRGVGKRLETEQLRHFLSV